MLSLLLYSPHDGRGFSNGLATLEYHDILVKKCSDPNSYSILEVINKFCGITELEVQSFLNYLAEIYSHSSNEIFHIVKYEDFINGTLFSLEKRLGFKISSDVEVEANVRRVKRSAKYGDWKIWFSNQDVEYLERYYSNALNFFNYSTERDNINSLKIDYEQSSGYFVRVINQYRRMYCLPEFNPPEVVIREEGKYFDKAISYMQLGDYSKALDYLSHAQKSNRITFPTFNDLCKIWGEKL